MATGVYRRLSRINWIRRIFYKPVTPPVPGFFCPEYIAASDQAVSVMMMYSLSTNIAMDKVNAASFEQEDVLAVDESFDSGKAVDVVGEIC